jgi:hypothetical protein
MKVWIPFAMCLAVFAYSSWTVFQAKRSYFPPGSKYKVEVIVTGPDGRTIPAVERVSH